MPGLVLNTELRGQTETPDARRPSRGSDEAAITPEGHEIWPLVVT